MRIAIAGLQHETNTFAEGITGLGAFEVPGGWPPLCRGVDMRAELSGTSVPMAGALAEFDQRGIEVVPLLWAMAMPAGPVDHSVFEALRDQILAELSAAGPVDGVLLELHGAMVTTSEADPEGALMEAIRALLPARTPLVATLDLHANVSARMVAASDFLEIYRTYPHTDMPETGARAARRLIDYANGAPRPAKAMREIPFLLPLIAQATSSPTISRLYEVARAEERTGQADAISLAMGFPHADVSEAGPSITVYAKSTDTAERLAEIHVALWTKAEPELRDDLVPPEMAIAEARAALRKSGRGPVILADVQDNPGGGGTQDTTALLHALLAEGVDGAVMVHLCDPEAAAAAHAAGEGAVLDRAIGAARSRKHGAPVAGPWTVAALGSGSFTGMGPMYRGNQITLGPVALLTQRGVRCIVAPSRMQASEPGLLAHLGLDPMTIPVLALKSSVHFRAAYQDGARAIVLVDAPGDVPMDLRTLPYLRAARRVAGEAMDL
ncbi:MAG: M81 family metallopeptidase [Pseudomonadota bacterium]